MVDVMAETGDDKGKSLQFIQLSSHCRCSQKEEGEVGDGEGVRPVVVGYIPVSLGDSQHESCQFLPLYPISSYEAELIKNGDGCFNIGVSSSN